VPIRNHALSFRVTATGTSRAYKLEPRPLSTLEVVNLGKYPVYLRLGHAATVAYAIGAAPNRSVYLEPNGRVELDVDHRTHIVLVAPEKDCDVIIMQGAG
jgi:hypothetical protein